MKRPESLTSNVLTHLIKFAETRGRAWRSKLRDYWYTGTTSGFLDQDEAAALQAVRNSLANKLQRLNLETLHEWAEDDLYRRAADDLYHRDGEIEIDTDAKISRGDPGGAYVQAWVWVDHSELASV